MTLPIAIPCTDRGKLPIFDHFFTFLFYANTKYCKKQTKVGKRQALYVDFITYLAVRTNS